MVLAIFFYLKYIRTFLKKKKGVKIIWLMSDFSREKHEVIL